VHAVGVEGEVVDGLADLTCTEAIDTTGPQGETIFAVMVGMASMEREAIARRTWEGRRTAAQGRKLPSGPAPYGYRRKDGTLEIVDEEAEVVRRVYKMDRQGKGVRAIATALQKDGVPTRGRHMKDKETGEIRVERNPWSPWTVRAILGVCCKTGL
jgi:DNA invertase Pin-like site-specific DNA recombinase